MSGPIEGVPASPASLASAQKRRTRWIIAGLVLFLLLDGLLLPLINLGRYHRTIADSLTRSLGHTVHLGSVNLAVFPLPGVVIHDLTVEEDPSFGAEPLLRAPSVTVFLRLSSFWRDRIEISRIDLDNASVNLVRNNSGQWNFSSLLLQASRTPTAPTGQRRPSAAPRFPYIEFSSARINFKEGDEKKALSFLNADASVWLADPNHWRIRFEAQPARTDRDLDLEDTGTIRLDGSLTRATSLDQLPLKLHAEWTGAQLGQVSRLTLGSDSGWRGDLSAEADIAGDMRDLVIQSRLRVGDAHRQEFTPLTELNIDARCQATYHRPQRSLDNLTCLLPTGDGHLLLTGAVLNLTHPQPSLNLEINHTPVAFAVSVLGLLRSTLPTSLDASGTINGQFTWAPENITGKAAAPQKIPAGNILTGHAIADTVSIRLAGIDPPITFASLHFATPPAPPAPAPHHREKIVQRPDLPANVILLEPATFAAGAPTPMQVTGQFSRSAFSLHFTGEGAIARLQPVVSDIGQLRPALENLAAKGTAQVDLSFSGPWIPPINIESGASSQAVTAPSMMRGWVRLEHAQLKPAWLPEPIEIETATAQFGDGSIAWADAGVSVNGIVANGSVSYSTACDNPQGCPAQVNLDFPTLDAAALQSALLGAGRHGELLQAILSQVESPAPPWPAIDGTLHAGTLSIGSLKLNNARAAITVRDRRLNILSLDSSALGGSAHATGSIEATSDGPKYALNLTWTGVSLAETAALFHEKWGTGSLDGQMSLNLHGYSSLASTATGDFHWILNGNWPRDVADFTLLDVQQAKSKSAHWTASGTIADQALTLQKGPARGTISFDRKLNLDWNEAETRAEHAAAARTQNSARNQPPLQITGTLAHPIAGTATSETAAKRPVNPQGN